MLIKMKCLEHWLYVFTLISLMVSIQCSSDALSCKLGFVQCPDESGTVCSDYLCTSLPNEERCEELETDTVCNSTARFEVQYQLKEGESFANFLSKFSTTDKSSIADKIKGGTQSDVGEIETLVYSSVFGLRLYVSRSQWYGVLIFCQTSTNLFDSELSGVLDYQDYIFLPSVSQLKLLTETPREGQELKFESHFMKTSGYSQWGNSWKLNQEPLSSNWFTITSIGTNLFRSQLQIPAEEVSIDSNGQYLFLYSEDLPSGYTADSLKVDVHIKMKPVVSSNGSSEFFIGLTPPATFCCNVESSDANWTQNLRLEFEPALSKSIESYPATNSDGKELVCTELEFEEPYEGSLVCLYPYWDGDATSSVSIASVQALDSDFCGEAQDDTNDVTWPKTLVPRNSAVSVDLDCPSGYDGKFSRVCFRDETSNVALWNASVSVQCHSSFFADPCKDLTSYDTISTCLVNLNSYFDPTDRFSVSKFQTSDTVHAILTLREIINSFALVKNPNLQKVQDLYGNYLHVIKQLVQVPSLTVWKNVDETSDGSFYSNFELILQMNSVLFGILDQNGFFLNPTKSESENPHFQKWTFFRMQNHSSVSLLSESENLVIEFDLVDLAAISLLPESVPMLEQLSKGTLSPNVAAISSNNQGLYTVRFEGVPLDEWVPECKYLDFNNQWSNDSCFIRYEGDVVKCRCQHLNQPASVNALFLQERTSLSFSRSALERVFKNICSIIAMLLFIAALVLLIRYLQPFTERSFVLCQFAGAQLLSTFLYMITFVNKVEMSPNSCAALTAFTKFLFLYSFLWLRFEAKYTKKSIVNKIKNSVEEEMTGRVISRKMIIHCIISILICAMFIALTEIMHYFLDEQYPPEFESSICQMLQDHYLTNFIGAVLSVFISYLQHLLLFRKLYVMSHNPETAYAVKKLRFYHSKTVRLILLVIYPAIILCVIFQLISYYTDTQTFTILWGVTYMLAPGLLILYAISVHRSEALGKKPIWKSSPAVQKNENSEEATENLFQAINETN